MATLIFNGETYIVDHAVKGTDYVHGYDANGRMVTCISGVVDFSAIEYDGEYLAPEACLEEACNSAVYVNGTLQTKLGNVIPASYSELFKISGNYTLALNNAGKLGWVESQAIITVPNNTSVPFPTKTEIEILSYTDASVTFAAATGVSLLSLDDAKSIAGKYGVVTLKKIGANLWVLAGALS
jgi:hypothetical protein